MIKKLAAALGAAVLALAFSTPAGEARSAATTASAPTASAHQLPAGATRCAGFLRQGSSESEIVRLVSPPGGLVVTRLVRDSNYSMLSTTTVLVRLARGDDGVEFEDARLVGPHEPLFMPEGWKLSLSRRAPSSLLWNGYTLKAGTPCP